MVVSSQIIIYTGRVHFIWVMSLIDIEKVQAFEPDDGVVRCRVCKAEMKPAEIGLKDRLARLLIGASTTIMRYQCPDCKKELITMEK